MPTLDNLRSVQRLSYIALNAAVFCHKQVKQHGFPAVEGDIAKVRKLFDYLIALNEVYAFPKPVAT